MHKTKWVHWHVRVKLRSHGCQPPSINLFLSQENYGSVQLHKQRFAYSAKESDNLEQKADLVHRILNETSPGKPIKNISKDIFTIFIKKPYFRNVCNICFWFFLCVCTCSVLLFIVDASYFRFFLLFSKFNHQKWHFHQLCLKQSCLKFTLSLERLFWI